MVERERERQRKRDREPFSLSERERERERGRKESQPCREKPNPGVNNTIPRGNPKLKLLNNNCIATELSDYVTGLSLHTQCVLLCCALQSVALKPMLGPVLFVRASERRYVGGFKLSDPETGS